MKNFANTPKFGKKKQENPRKTAFKAAQRRAAEAKGIGATRGAHGPTPSIELYQKESCPFSHAVRNKLNQLGLDFVAHTVPEGNALKHEQLVQAGGKDQVPLLIDHSSGVKLYESPSIIAYLDKSYGQPAQGLFGRIATGIDSRIRSRADQVAWAFRVPLLRANALRDEMKVAYGTVRGSLGFLRDRIESAMRSTGKPPVEPAPAAPSSKTRSRPASVRANVASITDAA